MKIINITNGVLTALILASTVVTAETQYPASDFQPKVIYQDADYKHTPASSTSAPSSSSATDPKYPAANFQPKVVYTDPNYKPSQSTASAGSSSTSAPSSTADANAEAKNSDSTYLVGLLALVVAGVFFYKKQAGSSCPSSQVQHRTNAGSPGGLTGVAKYINRTAGTGVARYIEKQMKSVAASAPLTGVAKYMANQAGSGNRETSTSKAATGVEKYMRKRG